MGGGLTERKAFKHFGEELITICQQEPGLKYWRGSTPSRKILGELCPPPLPMPMRFIWFTVYTVWCAIMKHRTLSGCSCECGIGYTGDTCSYVVDNCDPNTNPCLNDDSCLSLIARCEQHAEPHRVIHMHMSPCTLLPPSNGAVEHSILYSEHEGQ